MNPDNAEHELCACTHPSVVLERNRFFTGKYMRARDFQIDQDYFVSRHRLHNRALHGWGIVCGLDIRLEHKKGCPPTVVVDPGMAIDCCGREVLIAHETRLPVVFPDLREVPDKRPTAGVPEPWLRAKCGSPAGLPALLVCLRYVEQGTELVPVLDECGGCGGHESAANRVRESAEITFARLLDLPGCWPSSQDAPPQSQPAGEGSSGCVDPVCECGDCVPLGLLKAIGHGPAGDPEIVLDTSGRRPISGPADHHTRITRINWPHGGEVALDELKQRDGELRITFERPLQPADGAKTGINSHTLEVEHLSENRFRALVRSVGSPRLVDGTTAVFKIADSFLDPDVGSPIGSFVYVTLYGDFVLDADGRPVAVGHLRGQLPTGPGNVFRSWFKIVEPSGKVAS